MNNGEPRDKKLVEPGPTPPNAERHGVWRILTKSMILVIIGMVAIGIYFLW